ncbi:bucentaur or craniofacial development-domain-containing protein [Filobasidium floriforme]|uniref:bucentaur or craniofacial development-domain-containing protein n=1 Tax=Filobasidium floriforme TaxID=5210 RepID=UPI001E8DF2D1|nr:bucentaur or craniofacial development-domain-containing protein [Filobasidium floriforme]KAH8081405.1 bucentaur or craniofacial development-domain-containing protein [Filobasidium floriforme]
MANKRPQNLLDSIDPNDSSDDASDADYALPEETTGARASKRRKAEVHVSFDNPERAELTEKDRKIEEEKQKVERRRKADEEWAALMRVEEEAKRERMGTSSSSASMVDDKQEKGETVRMVEVRRPRNFAGEIIYETVRLPADHPDVKKYTSSPPPSSKLQDQPGTKTEPNPDILSKTSSTSPPSSTIPSPQAAPIDPATTTTTTTTTPSSTTTRTDTSSRTTPTPTSDPNSKPLPRNPPPRRRKPRQSLESMNAELVRQASVARKMTTFEKSQLDWNSLTTSTPTLSTELEANRRTGGYLERQDFLGRVGERKEMRGQGGDDKRRRV